MLVRKIAFRYQLGFPPIRSLISHETPKSSDLIGGPLVPETALSPPGRNHSGSKMKTEKVMSVPAPRRAGYPGKGIPWLAYGCATRNNSSRPLSGPGNPSPESRSFRGLDRKLTFSSITRFPPFSHPISPLDISRVNRRFPGPQAGKFPFPPKVKARPIRSLDSGKTAEFRDSDWALSSAGKWRGIRMRPPLAPPGRLEGIHRYILAIESLKLCI